MFNPLIWLFFSPKWLHKFFFVLIFPLVLGVAGACSLPSDAEEPQRQPSPQFPQALKGYELYVWQERDRIWLTLITGTNREKTIDEIRSPGEVWSSNGWVKMTVEGEAAGEAMLAKLPSGEAVVLRPLPAGAGDGGDRVTPPSEHALDWIEAVLRENGIELIRME